MAILQVICPDIQGHDGAAGLGGGTIGTAPIADTANVYSTGQRASWKCVAAAGGQSAVDITPTTTALGNTWGIRWRQMFTTLPGSTNGSSFFLQVYQGGTTRASMSCDNSNHVVLGGWPGGSFGAIGSPSAASLVAGRWHTFDLTVTTPSSGNSTLALVMDGVTVASSTAVALSNVAIDEVGLGCTFNAGGTGNITTNVTDVMIWDSTGSSHNAVPTSQLQTWKLANAIADIANTGWKAGLTSTSAIWDGTNSLPPVGIITASATVLSQITNADSTTTEAFEAAMQNPAALGVSSADTLLAAIAYASVANNTTTARSIGLSAQNPAITEALVNTGTTVAGTWPAGWTTRSTAPVYSPTASNLVTMKASVRKNIASTDTVSVAALMILIEHIPVSTAVSSVFRAHSGAWV